MLGFQALCLCLCFCHCLCLCICLCICVLLWFFIAFIVSFQNMYGHRGLWGLRAEKMIIFEVMTDGHSPIPLGPSSRMGRVKREFKRERWRRGWRWWEQQGWHCWQGWRGDGGEKRRKKGEKKNGRRMEWERGMVTKTTTNRLANIGQSVFEKGRDLHLE